MLSKAWREVLQRGVKIILLCQQAYFGGDFRFWCAPCCDEIELVRDSCRVLDWQENVGLVRTLYCTLSMPWSTFLQSRQQLSLWVARYAMREEKRRARHAYPVTIPRIYELLRAWQIDPRVENDLFITWI